MPQKRLSTIYTADQEGVTFLVALWHVLGECPALSQYHWRKMPSLCFYQSCLSLYTPYCWYNPLCCHLCSCTLSRANIMLPHNRRRTMRKQRPIYLLEDNGRNHYATREWMSEWVSEWVRKRACESLCVCDYPEIIWSFPIFFQKTNK